MRFWRAMGVALGVGLLWYGIELAATPLLGHPLGMEAIRRDFLRFLPWQMALFAAIGVPLTVLTAVRPLSTGVQLAIVVGLASFVFLGARVVEGALRRQALGGAVLGVLGVAVAIAIALWALHRAGRWLPARARRAWPLALCVGWSVFFVQSMHRAGLVISRRRNPWAEVADLLSWSDAGLALGACLTLLAVGSLLGSRAPARAMVACLLALSAPTAARAQAAADRPDVLIVLVDTYRFDHLGANVGRADLTPRLDELAAESIRFTRAFSPGNYTKLALPGIHTSLPEPVTGERLAKEVDTIAERLQRAGYATAGISSNPRVSAYFNYDQGFDWFVDPNGSADFLVEHLLQLVGAAIPGRGYQLGIVTSSLYYLPAMELREGVERMSERVGGRPRFLYVHTMDPHGPYLPPHRYLPPAFRFADFFSYHDFNRLTGRGVLGSPAFARHLTNLKQLYEAEVRYTDEELGRLFDRLRREGRWDKTLVWLLSDHGEAFGEHDYAGHAGSNMTTTLLHVPLLLKLPRSWNVAPRVVEEVVSTYDVLPTTLGLLGLPPLENAFGRDLSAEIRSGAPMPERVVVSYGDERGTDCYSAIRWPWKLDVAIPRNAEPRRHALFDLARDPAEEHDLSGSEPALVAALEEELEAWLARERASRIEPADGDTDDAVIREQLRQLGYVE